MAKKYIVGILMLVLLASSIYIFQLDTVKLNVDKYQSKFYVWDNESWDLQGREFVYLYKGSTKKNAMCGRDVDTSIDNNITTITRTVDFCRGTVLKNTYVFDGSQSDVELFPISHDIECTNCEGYILHYEVRDIEYDGETKVIESPFAFGKNMNVEWEEGSYFNKVYQQKSSDKIIIRYRPDEEVFNKEIRLFDPPASGSGTEGDPYIITTCDELNSTNDDLDAYYELGNDIDCSGYTGYKPIGKTTPYFTGYFNGKGYKISNLVISESSNFAGLFGQLRTPSELSNFIIENISITTGNNYAGGIAGYVFASNLIENISVTGTISTASNSGGAFGFVYFANVNNCIANVNITSTGSKVGGFVGQVYGNINNSYSIGNKVSSTSYPGGFAGEAATGSNIINSYTITNVSGTGPGGFESYSNAGSFSSCYWDYEKITGATNDYRSGDLTGVSKNTTAQMITQSTYIGWDFDNVWGISEFYNDGYPYLLWEDPVLPDTCTYSSGDWNINCADNCVITSPVDLGTNNINAYGSGTVNVDTTISNVDNLIIQDGCQVIISDGNEVEII
jgi:hypothetical protein